jgi:iron(III) transport system substrate-binding protein
MQQTSSRIDDRVVLHALSAMEEYELEDYRAAFHAEHPGIDVSITRLSTRKLHAHLLELGETRAWDVVLGWSQTTLVDPAVLELLGTLDDTVLDQLPGHSFDSSRRWMSPSGFAPAFCLAAGIMDPSAGPVPVSWDDLADARFEGGLCLPDPNVSGAGFLHLTALVEERGFDGARKVLQGVARNRPELVQSAFAPCSAVLEGRAKVGATVSTATARLAREGHAVGSVLPSDAARYELEAFALNHHSTKRQEASELLRWMAGPKAAEITAAYGKIVTTSSVTDPIATESPEVGRGLTPIDAAAAARRRGEMCGMWDQVFATSP